MGGLPQAGVELVVKGLSGFLGGLKQGEDAVRGFGSQTGNVGQQTRGASEIMVGALRHVGEIAVDSLMKAGQAIGGFIKDSIDLAGNFEDGMLQFQSIAGQDVDTKGLEQFRSLFIQIGKDLPVSTSEVQKAAIELVKGGIDPATVAAGGLKQTIQFAAAAMNGDLAGAAEMSAKIVGGWAEVNATAAEKAELLASATDLVAKAANASTVDAHDLSLGLYNVQGTAKAMGISLEETVTTLAELAPNFSDANTAGTSWRNFLIRLQPTTKSATAAMEGLGLVTADGKNKFFDAQGQFVGTAKASQLLADATRGLTAEQRTNLMQTIFGNDAMNAAIVLANNGADGYNNMTTALGKANGVLAAGAITQSGFNTSIENIKGSIEALQITLGSKLLPYLQPLIDQGAKIVNTATDVASAVFGDAEAFGKLSPALQEVVTWVQQTAAQVEEFANTTLKEALGTALQFVTEHWQEFAGALTAVAVVAAIVGIGSAIAALANPVTLIITAIGLLGAAWAGNWGGIQDKTKVVWEYIKPVVTELYEWVATNLPKGIAVVSEYWTTTLQPAMQQVGDFIISDVVPALKMIWSVITNDVIPTVKSLASNAFGALGTATNFISDLWTGTLQPAFKGVWTFLNTYVFPLFSALANVYMAIVEKETQGLSDLWTGTLHPALKSVSEWIDTTLGPIWKTLSGERIGQVLVQSGALSDFWTKTLRPALEALGSFILTSVNPAWKSMGDVVQTAVDTINAIGDAVTTAISYLNKLAEAIRGTPKMPENGMGGGGGSGYDNAPSSGGGGPSFVGKGAGMQSNTVSPVASPAQIMNSTRTSSTSYSSQVTYSMPVYTNNTPQVVQHGFYLMQSLAGG